METPDDPVLEQFLAVIRQWVSELSDGCIIALDGRSGAGKSTLACQAADALDDCVVIDGDSFYRGGTAAEWDSKTAREKATNVIDWQRQLDVLASLRAGQPGVWHEFDWDAFDGRLNANPTICQPSQVIILDGAYSARPELSQHIHRRVLVEVPPAQRLAQLSARDGDVYRDDWLRRWTEAEDFYFTEVVPTDAFDLVLRPRR